MKLVNATPGILMFDFVSVRGEHAHDRAHIHKGSITFVSDNRIEGRWSMSDDKDESEAKKFYLIRAK